RRLLIARGRLVGLQPLGRRAPRGLDDGVGSPREGSPDLLAQPLIGDDDGAVLGRHGGFLPAWSVEAGRDPTGRARARRHVPLVALWMAGVAMASFALSVPG